MKLVLATLLLAVTAHAQSPPRAIPRTITIESKGEAPLDRVAWQFNADATSMIQVRTRTVSGERAVKDIANDQESVLRMYTLLGTFQKNTPITTATWRILDAGARHDDPTAEDLPPDGLHQNNEDQAAQDLVGTSSSASSKGTETFAERFTRLSDATLKGLNGASLRQKVTPTGLIASGTIPILEDLTLRMYSEAMNLAFLVGLSEAALPEVPIGIGARWSTAIDGEKSGVRVRTAMTWTLKEREGDHLKLGVTYKTRVLENTNESRSKSRVARLDRNGHGEVTIDLSNPLGLSARLIQLPLPENASSPDVTWITIGAIKEQPKSGVSR